MGASLHMPLELSWYQWLFLFLLFVVIGLFIFWWVLIRPKVPQLNDDWQSDCAFIPNIMIEGDRITIDNFRDFQWNTMKDKTEVWTKKSVNINDLVNVWYIVDHFHSIKALAHSMLSFEFRDGTYLVASFETRRRKGQRYNPWHGLWRAYELCLIWGSERDLIGLRTHVRKNKVHLYCVSAIQKNKQALFLELCQRSQQLTTKAEWYHSIFTTCLTSIVQQVNRVVPKRIPLTWRYLLPGHSTRAAFKLGLIQDWGGYKNTVQLSQINLDVINDKNNETSFNQKIREHLPKEIQ